MTQDGLLYTLPPIWVMRNLSKLLLESGNSPAYVRNKKGLSALHIAANTKNDNRAVMKELMEVCPDMYELLDNKGRNALHVAAESGRWAAFFVFSEEARV